jgi:predicted dehydrogenase
MTAGRALRVGIAGIHGHGAGHVATALDLERSGRIRLVAVADPRPPEGGLDGVAAYDDTERMLRDEALDVVVLSTPMHTHLPLAHAALHAGAHVLLEKPPTPTLADFERLVAASAETGRAVQIGFQSLGSSAIGAVRDLIDEGAIGDVVGSGALGTWPRTEQYWRRAPWAGRRTLDGAPVVDGAVTNPLAHAMATALAVAGATTTADVSDVELDLYRANEIEADDTSSLIVSLAAGGRLAAALSVTASRRSEPCVVVRGTRGRIVLWYTLDLVQVFRHGSELPATTAHSRTGLLANLVDHVQHGVPLLVPATATGAFMRVLEAVRTGEGARQIDARFFDRVHDDDGEGGDRRVVRDLEAWSERVVLEGRTFRELGAPWTVGGPAPTAP